MSQEELDAAKTRFVTAIRDLETLVETRILTEGDAKADVKKTQELIARLETVEAERDALRDEMTSLQSRYTDLAQAFEQLRGEQSEEKSPTENSDVTQLRASYDHLDREHLALQQEVIEVYKNLEDQKVKLQAAEQRDKEAMSRLDHVIQQVETVISVN